MRLAFFPLTDLGNAERFRERYKDKLLWCPALGWLAWDGKRWSRDGADDLVKIAEHDTVRAIQEEAEAVRESGRKDVTDPRAGARDYVVKVDATTKDDVFRQDRALGPRSEAAEQARRAVEARRALFRDRDRQARCRQDEDQRRNGTLVVARKSGRRLCRLQAARSGRPDHQAGAGRLRSRRRCARCSIRSSRRCSPRGDARASCSNGWACR